MDGPGSESLHLEMAQNLKIMSQGFCSKLNPEDPFHTNFGSLMQSRYQKILFEEKAGRPRFGSVRLRFGGGTVRAIPVFGSGGSSAKKGFSVFQYSLTGRFRFRFLENGSSGSGSAFGFGKNGSDGSGSRFRFGS